MESLSKNTGIKGNGKDVSLFQFIMLYHLILTWKILDFFFISSEFWQSNIELVIRTLFGWVMSRIARGRLESHATPW